MSGVPKSCRLTSCQFVGETNLQFHEVGEKRGPEPDDDDGDPQEENIRKTMNGQSVVVRILIKQPSGVFWGRRICESKTPWSAAFQWIYGSFPAAACSRLAVSPPTWIHLIATNVNID